MFHLKNWLYQVEKEQKGPEGKVAKAEFRVHRELMTLMVRRPY